MQYYSIHTVFSLKLIVKADGQKAKADCALSAQSRH